jgi:phage gp29-like protein
MLIEFLEASRTGSIDTYEKLCRYMDTQISLAVLGEELSTSAKPTGLGSGVADVQNDVRLELVKADADLLSSGPMKLLSAWITEFNVPGAKPPSIYRIVEEAQDLSALAERDSKIAAMGFKPTLKYITDTYGGEWVEVTPRPAPGPGFPSPLFAEPGVGAPAQARLDSAITGIPETVLQRQAEAALAPVLDLVRGGASFSEIMEKLATTFPDMHTDGLEELLARAMFASDLWGQVNTNAGRT